MTHRTTRHIRRLLLPAALLLLAACPGRPAGAAVLSMDEVPLRSIKLSRAGTIDWMLVSPATWGTDNRLGPCDCSREGRGITRWVLKEGGVQVRPVAEAWPRLGWEDGGRQAVRPVAQGGFPEPGPAEAVLAGDGRLVFTFAPPEGRSVRLASVSFLSAAPIEAVAVQDGVERRLVLAGACGVVQVRYGAGGPLELRLAVPAGGAPVAVRGLAATLSEDCAWLVSHLDFVRTFPRADQAALLADGVRRPAPDFLKVARDYADAMIRGGRDTYGPVASPLFATLLLRTSPPRPGPDPLFAQPDKEWNLGKTPFRRFDYNVCLNYPDGLGPDGPHRVTLAGADPWEDAPLHALLADLSRLCGDPRYAREGEAALRWWFTNTQSTASGLYPWGAHMGWDLGRERPAYQDGPSRHLYGAGWHDIEDGVPGLAVLAALPAEDDHVPTPLARYARGIRDAHIWDRERFFFSRRGDYDGVDDREGSPTGSPAALGAFLRVWTAALLQSSSDMDRADMLAVLGATADSVLARAERFGALPRDFGTELAGGPPAPCTDESLRLAHHLLFAADSLRQAHPGLAARLERAALAGLGAVPPERARQNLALYDWTGETFLLEDTWRAGPGGGKPPAQVRDLSRFADSGPYAAEIVRLLALYRVHGERAYLDAAVSCGKLAGALFCDNLSALPRFFVPAVPLQDYDGKPFPDFSFRGGRLMHAFALLAETGVDERRSRQRR